ncbi:NAD(P)/FAD-dependent oxidoreductase [Vibrio sp. SS-MA-C1-2]|uniref:NAD(P)/FAD-dependent oxidoreductase n=1 Tax=Vibrio sp. SS-MA-C1-2 TaxID=2908646 RepID=UPI001F4448E7|nr:NAD(P)/FAD-dependent oxidoreductase [Vibrio sp. SS-MA-C1-2]UJF18051.1 NAD(P)/FAD-dependent oxidoreductase [Vibrio sp. SS-MA-C1-2]
MNRIVIVGGGAGGLELATKLGKSVGRNEKAQITLIDRNKTHLWKPLLHEVATGALDSDIDGVSYLAHGHHNGFTFKRGNLSAVDRENKTVTIDPIKDDAGNLVITQRTINYDILVLAIGSKANDFNTSGVAEHCLFLDSSEQALHLREIINNEFTRINAANSSSNSDETLDVAIVGGGATGVELSAELHNAVIELNNYGMSGLNSQKLNINLIESHTRLLAALPEKIATKAQEGLEAIGVNVRCNTRVTQAEADGFITGDGEKINAKIMVWAAGVKAPEFLKNIDGLETNRINQLVINGTLQTTMDQDIFAIGDCASFVQADNTTVPPTGQAAHQMAMHCYKNICKKLNYQRLDNFSYTNKGTLVSLSRFNTVGCVTKKSVVVKGQLAHTMYGSIYRMHQLALHGYMRTGFIMLASRLNKKIRPSLKLD